jgi:hypothetical protein
MRGFRLSSVPLMKQMFLSWPLCQSAWDKWKGRGQTSSFVSFLFIWTAGEVGKPVPGREILECIIMTALNTKEIKKAHFDCPNHPLLRANCFESKRRKQMTSANPDPHDSLCSLTPKTLPQYQHQENRRLEGVKVYLIDLKCPSSATALLGVVIALALSCAIDLYPPHGPAATQ